MRRRRNARAASAIPAISPADKPRTSRSSTSSTLRTTSAHLPASSHLSNLSRSGLIRAHASSRTWPLGTGSTAASRGSILSSPPPYDRPKSSPPSMVTEFSVRSGKARLAVLGASAASRISMHGVQEGHRRSIRNKARIAVAHVREEKIRRGDRRRPPPRCPNLAFVRIRDSSRHPDSQIAYQAGFTVRAIWIEQPNLLVVVPERFPLPPGERGALQMLGAGRHHGTEQAFAQTVRLTP